MRRITDTEIEKRNISYNYTIMIENVSKETKCPHCKKSISLISPKMMTVIYCPWCCIKILVLEEHEEEFMIKRD